MKTPPTTYFVKKAVGLAAGSKRPGHSTVAEISAKQIYEIAVAKQADFPLLCLESLSKSIAGTCRSMGVQILPLAAPAPLQAEAAQEAHAP